MGQTPHRGLAQQKLYCLTEPYFCQMTIWLVSMAQSVAQQRLLSSFRGKFRLETIDQKGSLKKLYILKVFQFGNMTIWLLTIVQSRVQRSLIKIHRGLDQQILCGLNENQFAHMTTWPVSMAQSMVNESLISPSKELIWS